MRHLIYGIPICVMLMFSGCGALQSALSGAYNLANCDYKYQSISNLTVMDINLANGLSPLMAPALLTIHNGNASSIPLNFTLNLDVKNPNAGAAAFQTMGYIISIDDIRFTTGSLNQAFHVDAGQSKTLPMNIGFDVAELITNNSRTAVVNVLKNFLGLSDQASSVTVQLKPSFKVGEQLFTSPVYIPVSFTFGGKK